jgi:hypothetical protein
MILGGWLLVENSRLRNLTNATEARRIELQEREKQLQEEIAGQQTANAEKEAELSRIRDEIARLETEREQDQKHLTELEQERKRLAEQPVKPTPRQTVAASRVSIAAFFLRAPVRGLLPTLAIPEKSNTVEIQLELESADFIAYRVVLRNQAANQTLWQSGKLKSKSRGANKVLNVQFPAALLNSQVYTLAVSGVSSNGKVEFVGDYPFQVVQ